MHKQLYSIQSRSNHQFKGSAQLELLVTASNRLKLSYKLQQELDTAYDSQYVLILWMISGSIFGNEKNRLDSEYILFLYTTQGDATPVFLYSNFNLIVEFLSTIELLQELKQQSLNYIYVYASSQLVKKLDTDTTRYMLFIFQLVSNTPYPSAGLNSYSEFLNTFFTIVLKTNSSRFYKVLDRNYFYNPLFFYCLFIYSSFWFLLHITIVTIGFINSKFFIAKSEDLFFYN